MVAVAGSTALVATSGSASAQEVPEFGSYLSDARLYDGGVDDVRGETSVTVDVGAGSEGVAFDPPTVWIDPGTTVTWEWTGEGGGHNVVPEEGPAGFEHEEVVSEEGTTYEYEFTEGDAGITTYKCIPHESLGMKGGVAVGDDVSTVDRGGDDGGAPSVVIPERAYSVFLAALLAAGSVLVLGYVFMKYEGDRNEV